MSDIRLPLSFFTAKASLLWGLLILGLGAGLGVVTARLVVAGDWQLAVALVAILPGLVLLHKYPFLAVVAWLVLGPFLLHTDTSAERQLYWLVHRALPPLTLGILLISTALRLRPRKLPRLGVPEAAMAGYVLLSVFSILLQDRPPLATLYLFYDRVFSPMCLYLLVRFAAPTEREVRWLLPVAFFITLSQCVFGLLSWSLPQLLPPDWVADMSGRTVGSLVKTNVYTSTLILTSLLLLHAALNMHPGWLRKVLILLFLLTLYAIFISYSRASWMAGGLLLVGLAAIYPRFVLKLALLAVPAVLLFGALLFTEEIEVARQRLYSEEAERSALSRLPVYYASVRMFQTKPYFGWGYETFDLYDRQFQGRVADLAHDNKDHASHNMYLTLIAEQGLVGLLLFMAPAGWWLVQSVRKVRAAAVDGFWSRKLLAVLWLAIVSQVLLNSFSNLRVTYGLGLWWVALALVAHFLHVQPALRSAQEIVVQEPAVWRVLVPASLAPNYGERDKAK